MKSERERESKFQAQQFENIFTHIHNSCCSSIIASIKHICVQVSMAMCNNKERIIKSQGTTQHSCHKIKPNIKSNSNPTQMTTLLHCAAVVPLSAAKSPRRNHLVCKNSNWIQWKCWKS